MKINHAIEKQDGTVTFQGTLEGPELAFVIEVGINKLMQEGVIPFVSKKSHNPSSLMMDSPETEQ